MGNSLRLLGTGALLFAGSFLGSYFANTHGLENAVKEEVKKTRLEARITLPFGTDTLFTIPDAFSARENFDDDPEDYDYWKSKAGFKYRTDNLKDGVGTEYSYSVLSGLDEGAEYFCIWNQDGRYRILGTSSIYITDEDHDAVPDWITIDDNVNNTSVRINRPKRILSVLGFKGGIRYKGCNEETAKALFDLYTVKFQEFQRVHNIRARIDAYAPRMEIVEMSP